MIHFHFNTDLNNLKQSPGKLIWSGTARKVGSYLLTTDASNYSIFIVRYTDGSGKFSHAVVYKNIVSEIQYNSLDKEYGVTSFSCTLKISDTRFEIKDCIYGRTWDDYEFGTYEGLVFTSIFGVC